MGGCSLICLETRIQRLSDIIVIVIENNEKQFSKASKVISYKKTYMTYIANIGLI